MNRCRLCCPPVVRPVVGRACLNFRGDYAVWSPAVARVNEVNVVVVDSANPTAVRAQLQRLYLSRHFRGSKARGLLDFLVDEWLADGGRKLTVNYIGQSLKDEPLTFEEHADRWGYPKTRANLVHLRNRLRHYYETEGYRDPIVVKLNPGSFAPVIAANPVSSMQPDIDPEVARLIFRAKTSIDIRTLKGAWRALRYFNQIPANLKNPRQTANIAFIPMAVAPILSCATMAIRQSVETLIRRVKASGVEPWECIFAEACAEACYRHNWKDSLRLFELAIAASQEEAKYYWWYTALLASQGRLRESINILDSAVRHFSRTNIATIADLAVLQITAGYFAKAEETLLGSFDFAAPDNPLILCNLVILYEAQDRLKDAMTAILPLLQTDNPAGPDASPEEFLQHRDLTGLLGGMVTLVAGRMGVTNVATVLLDTLLTCKATKPASSSVEIALGLIGLERFDEAVTWLRKAALEESEPIAMWFHIFPPLRHLRAHPGFKQLLKALKLQSPR